MITYRIPGNPIHEHDCEHCEFLGNASCPNEDEGLIDGADEIVWGDMYVCRNTSKLGDCVIIRFRPDGAYYSSSPTLQLGSVEAFLAESNEPTWTATKLIIAKTHYWPGSTLQMACRLNHGGY